MKKSRFESELSSLDKLMRQDLKKKERKQIVERLRSLIDRVDRYANSGKLPKEAALRIRIDLLYLVKQAKKKDLGSESSRQRLHDLVEARFFPVSITTRIETGHRPRGKTHDHAFPLVQVRLFDVPTVGCRKHRRHRHPARLRPAFASVCRHLSAGKTLGSVPPLLHLKHATAEAVPVNRGLPLFFWKKRGSRHRTI